MAKLGKAIHTARLKQRADSKAGLASARAWHCRVEIEESFPKLSRDLLRRAQWKHGLSKEDASDVVQETFLVGLLKTGPVRNTRAWLEGVLDHLAINLLRTRARRAKLLARWGPGSGRAEEAEETFDEL